jgi:hypothetical protein
MNGAQRQIEELLQAKRDLIESLESKRAEKHEQAAKIGDEIVRLKLGDRR